MASNDRDNPRRGPGYEIFKLLVMPILPLRPQEVYMDDFLRQAFNTNTRIISKYQAIAEFTMPGQHCPNGTVPERSTLKTRFIKKGTKMLCRVDDVTGDIHIEIGARIFYLSKLDWKKIRSKLKIQKGEEELV